MVVYKLLIVALLSMIPWGEWAIAIPAGLLLKLPFNLVVGTAFTANLIPVVIICIIGNKAKNRLLRWQEKRKNKSESLLKRYGIMGLILVAPMSVGVYISSITALLMGTSPKRIILLHIIALVFWGTVISILYLLGFQAWELMQS